MSWRKTTTMILFAPIMAGLLVFFALVVVWKLPLLCCERLRAVRYLPYLGALYYGLIVPGSFIALGLAWWEVLIFTAMFALCGDWLLPDPFTYLFNPRKRRAVKLAIEYFEAKSEPWPNYGRLHVIGLEADRTIVSVEIKGSARPPVRRFLAVAHATSTVEVLDFEYVATKHGVEAFWM